MGRTFYLNEFQVGQTDYIINDYRKPKEEVRETKYEKLFLEFQQRDAILTLRVHLFIHSFIQILWGLKT